MRISGFEYHAPASLDEALGILSHLGPEARPLAGGTDLIPHMKHGLRPGCLVWLGNLAELKGLTWNRDEVRIGALTLHADLAGDRELQSRLPVLARAISLIGSWQIRNTATLGGNLCNASPAADSAGPLMALGSSVVLAGPGGEEEMPLGLFFQGPGETALRPGQLLKEVKVPLPHGPSAGCYLKLMRKKAVDLALLGVAVQASADESGSRLRSLSIGLGGLAPTPIRAGKAEAVLAGLSLDQARKALDQAVDLACGEISPIDDVRATASYRRTVARVYLGRGLNTVLDRLAGKEGEGLS